MSSIEALYKHCTHTEPTLYTQRTSTIPYSAFGGILVRIRIRVRVRARMVRVRAAACSSNIPVKQAKW